LGNNAFRVPYGNRLIKCTEDTRPLVVMTTNEERELPAPFIRRCMVLNLALPTAPSDLRKRLVEIADLHQRFRREKDDRVGSCEIIPEAADALIEERDNARADGGYRPGLAEYLDLVTALGELWPGDKEAQCAGLEEIAQYSLRKRMDSSI